mmetsp:Transcript_14006/g.41074  ORF Transcript_14006/g.41074 Transcript_14006/m.41074 type:complete len:274 (-) Transcript_14006:314-1135(-)
MVGAEVEMPRSHNGGHQQGDQLHRDDHGEGSADGLGLVVDVQVGSGRLGQGDGRPAPSLRLDTLGELENVIGVALEVAEEHGEGDDERIPDEECASEGPTEHVHVPAPCARIEHVADDKKNKGDRREGNHRTHDSRAVHALALTSATQKAPPLVCHKVMGVNVHERAQDKGHELEGSQQRWRVRGDHSKDPDHGHVPTDGRQCRQANVEAVDPEGVGDAPEHPDPRVGQFSVAEAEDWTRRGEKGQGVRGGLALRGHRHASRFLLPVPRQGRR